MKRSAGLLTLGMMLAACGGGSNGGGSQDRDANNTPTPRTVSIAFSAIADSQPVACGTSYTLGTAATEMTLRDFRFYVHDLRLVTSTGTEVAVTLDQNDWQNGDVAMLDFQNKDNNCTGADKAIHTAITGTVPDGSLTFSGVRFTVGIPEDRNHLLNSSAPSPLNAIGMFWSWRSGYKFMRLDFNLATPGVITSTGAPLTAWYFHLGSTNCPDVIPYVCSNINRPEIALDSFNPDSDSIQIDYAALVADSNLSVESTGMPVGCMSGTTDAECPEMFTALGLNLASGENDASLVQTVFSVAH